MEWRELIMSWRQLLPRILILATLAYCVHGQALSCTGPTQCGSNSTCSNSTCVCQEAYFSLTGLNNDCISTNETDPRCSQYDANCIYCGTDFSGPCTICSSRYKIVESSSSCILECPGGFMIMPTLISSGNMVIRRVCEGGFTNDSSILPQWAVIVIGVVAGVIVLAVFGGLLGISIYILTKSSSGQFDVEDSQRGLTDSRAATLRTRRSNSFSYHKQENEKKEDRTVGHENKAFEEIDGDDETVFRHKLDYLCSQAEIFLRMLNDMRRRLKELPPDAPAATQYRNVMKDVTRLLFLLNKKPSTVEMPADGLQLLKWSQQILERYLASQGMAPKPWQTNRLSVLGPQEETQF